MGAMGAEVWQLRIVGSTTTQHHTTEHHTAPHSTISTQHHRHTAPHSTQALPPHTARGAVKVLCKSTLGPLDSNKGPTTTIKAQ